MYIVQCTCQSRTPYSSEYQQQIVLSMNIKCLMYKDAKSALTFNLPEMYLLNDILVYIETVINSYKHPYCILRLHHPQRKSTIRCVGLIFVGYL